jgi:sulfur-oxidizing protein SoxZ
MAKQKPMKIRAFQKGDTAEVKVLMFHPMETGLRKDKQTGQIIPAHFIKQVDVEHNGKKVMDVMMGVAVSKNPYLSFKLSNSKAGDSVKVSWTDNMGETDTVEGKVQ